jgi:BTB/POZ domain-containing protein KCTD9
VVKDEEGRYFIDRDGTHFRYILNFLRDGNSYIPSDSELLDELFEEVSFYQIQELQHRLEQERNPMNSCHTKKIDYYKFLQLLNFSQHPLQAPNLELSGLKLCSLEIVKANLYGCDFSNSDMCEINLSGCNLIHCNFTDSVIKNATFKDAICNHSTFINTNLTGSNMRNLSAKESNFSKANVSAVDLRDGDLSYSNFQDAILVSSNLERATFTLANIQGANFERANIKFCKGLLP